MKQAIIRDIYQHDDQLPSVRQLAAQLAINPKTIQKAYTELERQGVIYSLKSKGSFVGSSYSQLQQTRVGEIKEQIAELMAQLRELGMNQEEIINLVQQVWEQQEGGRK